MQGNKFTVSIHLHGTLAANAQGKFLMPCQATLIEVSAAALNDSDATLKVGTSADDDGYCQNQVIGDTGAPLALTQNGALISASGKTNVPDDTIIHWTLDYDGSSGTAGQNVSILFTFAE